MALTVKTKSNLSVEAQILDTTFKLIDLIVTGFRVQQGKPRNVFDYLEMMSLKYRNSKFLDQDSSRREFHHTGMWFKWFGPVLL